MLSEYLLTPSVSEYSLRLKVSPILALIVTTLISGGFGTSFSRRSRTIASWDLLTLELDFRKPSSLSSRTRQVEVKPTSNVRNPILQQYVQKFRRNHPFVSRCFREAVIRHSCHHHDIIYGIPSSFIANKHWAQPDRSSRPSIPLLFHPCTHRSVV